jgi:drug/metabolite transporter (DMT)-like permease
MINVLTGVTTRIISNSYLNVFQKVLTNDGNPPSVVNFYTYLGLSILSFCLFPFFSININTSLLINFFVMGILGALGNYYIIKALSLGELSSLAPINSYKPIVAMIIGFIYLNEIPSLSAVCGIGLIIIGTYILYAGGISNKKAVFYRVLALIFSGSEAIFIKKIILLTNIPTSFALWAISGLIFSALFLISSKHNLKLPSVKYLGLLILSVAIMQYSTNYVFSKINVSYALALFQLSTLLSVFLGVNIFKEKGLKRKLIASVVMITGAVTIILI